MALWSRNAPLHKAIYSASHGLASPSYSDDVHAHTLKVEKLLTHCAPQRVRAHRPPPSLSSASSPLTRIASVSAVELDAGKQEARLREFRDTLDKFCNQVRAVARCVCGYISSYTKTIYRATYCRSCLCT